MMKNNPSSQQYGLPHSTIQQIVTIFGKYSQLEKAILYGSRAKGNYRNGSDIDLTLIGKDLTYEDIGKIENDLDELLLPYTFDLSLFSHLANSDLLDHIERVGITFYEKEK